LKSYLLEPKAPLIIRSGRPFTETAGTDSARFPPPSTVAGALRAAYARSNNLPLNNTLLERSIKGPLAVKVDLDGNLQHVLVPKPADAHYFTVNGETRILAASPLPLADGEGCDLPAGLQPLAFNTQALGKPLKGPTWWNWDDFVTWRSDNNDLLFSQAARNGWTPPIDDIRTHTAVNDKTKSSEDGLLFQTAGLTMWDTEVSAQNTRFSLPESSIGLLASIDGEIKSELLNLGGERRISEINSIPNNTWPTQIENLEANILKTRSLIISLHTPALFNKGWLPGWLDNKLTGHPPNCNTLKIKLIATAINGWQAQSGWNLQTKQPRAARKMVPAGSTYWFSLYTHSILHCGTGQSIGNIDLPIARDTATQLPLAPGSSLRGVLRKEISKNKAEIAEHLFGPDYINANKDNFAGALSIGDANLLLLPVRALQGVIAYVTCPFLLKRYRKDIRKSLNIPPVAEDQAVHGANNVNIINDLIILEDLDLKPKEDAAVGTWATTIASTVFPEHDHMEYRKEIEQRFLIIPDTVFSYLAQTATDIRTRIRIDPTEGVVKDGHLWTEENLPPACVLWGVYALGDSHKKQGKSAKELAGELPNNSTIQIGGNGSTGSGLVQVFFDTNKGP